MEARLANTFPGPVAQSRSFRGPFRVAFAIFSARCPADFRIQSRRSCSPKRAISHPSLRFCTHRGSVCTFEAFQTHFAPDQTSKLCFSTPPPSATTTRDAALQTALSHEPSTTYQARATNHCSFFQARLKENRHVLLREIRVRVSGLQTHLAPDHPSKPLCFWANSAEETLRMDSGMMLHIPCVFPFAAPSGALSRTFRGDYNQAETYIRHSL